MSKTTSAAFLAAATLLAACSGAAAAPDGESAPDADVVEVVGVDYGFEAPASVTAGATLSFRNDSEVEYHELVVLRIADDESRSIEELLELPEDESMAAAEFVGVASALPEATGDVVQGTLTLTEPGRYALLCFIPQGADPDTVHAAFGATEDGPPPDLGDGAPHAFLGMVHELTVE